tara:strand:+ start:994 stop:1149 length:156 start_codon:yes stop_codon:yes gene_type:complete
MQAVTATIGKGAFANCTGLVKLTLPATLDKLSDNAFYGRDKPYYGHDCDYV